MNGNMLGFTHGSKFWAKYLLYTLLCQLDITCRSFVCDTDISLLKSNFFAWDFKINSCNVEINIETSSNTREKEEFFMVVCEGYKNVQVLLIWRSIIGHGP